MKSQQAWFEDWTKLIKIKLEQLLIQYGLRFCGSLDMGPNYIAQFVTEFQGSLSDLNRELEKIKDPKVKESTKRIVTHLIVKTSELSSLTQAKPARSNPEDSWLSRIRSFLS